MTLWRVQVLPSGTVSYRGITLDFTREYREAIAGAFDAGATGRVPFQLARADCRHTNDPDRFRGEVTGLEVVADGMDAVIDATPEGDEAIMTIPGLAAAPLLIQEYCTAEGVTLPAVLRHVLGTTRPLVTGLRAWTPHDPARIS